MANDVASHSERSLVAPRAAATFLVALAMIAIARFSIVDSPPYWDQAMGLWAEADAIVEHGFDMRRHLFEEKHFLEGGRATYRWCLAPYFVALLMWIGPSPRAAIVACHLLTFLGGALIATVIFESLRRSIGASRSLLVVVALMTVPLVCTQLDMVGQEIPLTAFAVLAGLAAAHRRYGWAAMAGLLAFFTKQSGIVVGTAVAIQATLDYWMAGKSSGARVRSAKVVGFCLLALAIEAFFASRETGGLARFLRINPFVFVHLAVWAPYFALAIAASLLAFARHWAGYRSLVVEENTSHDQRPIAGRLRMLVERDPEILFAALMVVGVIALATLVPALARYFVLAAPFVFLLLGRIALAAPPGNRWPERMLAALVLVNLLNWNGLLMPSPATALSVELFRPARAMAREGSILDRNHLYLRDHESNRAAVRAIARRAGNEPVFAGMPFTYFLTLPRLGYVQRPVRCIPTSSFGQPPELLDELARLIRHPPPRAVFVRVPNALSEDWRIFDVPLPDADDEILYEDDLEPRLIVFRKNLSQALGSGDAVRAWYVERFWPLVPYFEPQRNRPEALAVYRIRQWLRMGLTDLAARELDNALQTYPDSQPLRRLRASVAAATSGPKETKEAQN